MADPDRDSNFLSGVKDITAGSVRGFAQVAVGHPLDTIKVRLQTQSGKDARFAGVTDCFRETLKNEGVMGFYKGAQSPLLMAGVYSAILFLSYGQAKKFFHDPSSNEFTLREMIGIGITSGVIAASVESPMDFVKSKMQVQYQSFSGKANEYKSSIDCAAKVVKNQGLFTLFRGYDAAVLRNIPGTVLYFYSYEKIKYFLANFESPAKDLQPLSNIRQHPVATTPSIVKSSVQKQPELSPLSILTAGGLAGMLFWIAIFPLDVVKTRLQTDSLISSQRKYKSLWDCCVKTYRNEGVLAFYKGFKPCLIRAFPTNAASFLAFESARDLLGR